MEGERREIKSENAVFEKFKGEQAQKAKDKFTADPKFSLTPQEKEAFDREYDKVKSDSVDAELIFRDLKKAYFVVKGDELISSRDKVVSLEKNAAEWNAAQAGAGGGSGGSPDNDKYSQAAKDLFQDWRKAGLKNKTLDQAQSLVEKGGNWKNRSLSE